MLRFLRPRQPPVATVAFNLVPRGGSWGGGNHWASQLTQYLSRTGYRVVFRLAPDVDCVLLTHAGLTGHVAFGPEDVARLKRDRPRVRCVHRINENDLRKGTSQMDRLLADANRVADHTVFISAWLRDYHAERWFDRARPHSVILNGADPAIFHPVGNRARAASEPWRLVTHHWSPNWMKGFRAYQDLDARIAAGELSNVELHVVGRWPSEIVWKAARTHPPTDGRALASILRGCHLYVTASLWEPGGMHFIEGLQCGLPLVYHVDGGGIVELGERFGVGFRDDVVTALRTVTENYPALRERVLTGMPSGDLMAIEYRRIVQRVLAES
jgi:glycosyltransferase involved in cell wall biosynthesis